MTNLTRRNFIKIGAAGTATAILAGCDTDERWVKLETYVRPPEEQLDGIATWYATTCRQCPAGCGVLARVINGRAVKLEGNPAHPVNRGTLCARGQSGLQVLYNPDRVQTAARQEERGSRNYTPVAWNEAINELAQALDGAGGRVAVWLGTSSSGHLYDLFARFTDAIGAPPPIRYDLHSSFVGYGPLASASETLTGQAGVPAFNLGDADYVLSFGAEFLGAWFSMAGYGVEFGNFRTNAVSKPRGYLVQLEPRMSNTAASADRWLPIRPGTEALVAQALIRLIADGDAGPAERRERAAQVAGDVDLDEVASRADIPVPVLESLARTFVTANRPLAIPGGPLAGRADAAQAVAAVQALNFVAGNFGAPGGVTLTPEIPVEGLAAPPASTYADVTDLIARMANGEIDVLLVHGANPAFELPPSAGFREALDNVGLVVSFAPIVDETAALADLLLPDRTPLESWGYSVVTPALNGVPVVSSQQPVVSPRYDVRPTGDVLLAVAQAVPAAAGAMPWTDEVAFIKDMVVQLPEGQYGGQGDDVRWAYFLQHGGWWPAQTPDAEAPEAALDASIGVSAAEFQGNEGEYPYFLHLYLSPLLGDGSGASQPWLQGTPDPMTTISWQTWVEINPITADELGLDNGDVVLITSPYGEIEAPIYRYPAIRPDTIAIPVGQGHDVYSRYGRGRGANPIRLVSGEASADGNLTWATVRVKIDKRDENRPLAVFESTVDPGEHVHNPV